MEKEATKGAVSSSGNKGAITQDVGRGRKAGREEGRLRKEEEEKAQ